jgi:hypothetical protein
MNILTKFLYLVHEIIKHYFNDKHIHIKRSE